MIENNFVYDNQNNTSTNVFETGTGVLNIAPVKISGNYKILVSSRKNGYKLYLRDYTDRTIALDTTKEFIPQVCNFLQTSVITQDKTRYRYGGFQQNGKKYWHIPLYLGYKGLLPKYFVILKTRNISAPTNSQNYLYSGSIVDIIDLSEIYLTNIFKECTNEEYFRFPLIFDFDDKRIDLYGYDALSSSGAVRSFYIKDDSINNPEFEKINGKILDKFQENNLFFGRFLNLEFEFDYDTNDDTQHFNNFYGYLSYGDISQTITELQTKLTNISISQNLTNNICVFKKDTNDNKIITRRIQNAIEQPQEYTLDNGGFYVRDVNNQDYLYTVDAISYMTGDIFRFYDENNHVVYEYRVQQSDIKNTKLETFTKIADSITQTTFSMIDCKCTIIDEQIIMSFTSIDEYRIDITNSSNLSLLRTRYKTLDRLDGSDNFDKFMNIDDNDLMIVGNSDYIDTSIYKYLKINDIIYEITDNFKYNGRLFVRLDSDPQITSETPAILIEKRLEDIILLRPIKFMKYDSVLESKKFCEPRLNHIDEIYNTDPNNNTIRYLVKGEYEYVDDEIQRNVASLNETHLNETECNNIIFNMCGCSCFITPYVINIWKSLYETAGGLNYDYLNKNRDLYRFNWFLIKGPDYYQNRPANDARHLRYFSQKPLLTSRLSKISSQKCETTFLGVKYQLPIDFKDWQFAVYANIQFSENYLGDNSNLNYKVVANNDEQTIYLVINKYLKYNDFFGIGERELDISFLLNVGTSMNDSEQHAQATNLLGFNIGGNLSNDSHHENGNDWISINGTNSLIYIKDNNSGIDYSQYFIEGQDVDYIYPVRLRTGTNSYVDAKLFDVKLKNIQHITESSFWCEDIIIKMYPDKLYKINNDGYYELYREEEDYYQFVDPSVRDLIQRFYQMITDIDPNNKTAFYSYQDLNDGSYKISFKKNFYRIIYRPDGSVDLEYFDEFYKKPDLDLMSHTQKVDWFEEKTYISTNQNGLISYNGIPHDHDVVYDIFSSNLVMTSIRYLCREIYCVTANLSAVRNDIEEYSLNTFLQYSLLNNIELIYIDNEDNVLDTGTIKISAVYPIENSVVWDDENNEKSYFAIKRFNGQYNAYLEGLKGLNQEFLFQIEKFKQNGRLFSMYDTQYGRLIGVNGQVNATGIWE